MITIRRFDSGDAQAVSELIQYTMKISNIGDYPLENLQPLIDYFSPEKVLSLSKERDCLVAVIDDRIIGTIAIEKDELLTFFVHPHFQDRGVGTKLLNSIENIARNNGVSLINCEASLTALGFYKKRGYQLTGEDKDGTAGKQIGMQKNLV